MAGADVRWLGHALFERRGALELTPHDLAERAGVSATYVDLLEKGLLLQPDLRLLRQVARALGYRGMTELLDQARRWGMRQASEAEGEDREQEPASGAEQPGEGRATADAVDRWLKRQQGPPKAE